jgi:large subunit ribosomal protein L10
MSPAKAVYELSKQTQNLKILGGFFENEFKGAEDFIALAQLSSKEELLARVTGTISAPVTNFVRALQYNIKGLIYTLSAIKK